MIEENAKIAESVNLIEVSISEDKQQGFIKLEKQEDGNQVFTKGELINALQEQGIVFGINDGAIDKLVQRPIYNIRIKVAEAKAPIDGEDGKVKLLVKKDDEYKPEYSEEDTIDYKNLSYFQMVKKGQVLCEITAETMGLAGTNILGGTILPSKGRKPLVPAGKNTSLNEDETKLIADCDGIIKFVNSININEMLHITRNVDFSTGNIDFTGDVTIDGDVSSGFSVKAGGNLVVKGVVEEATKIESGGNVMISKGIYGGGSGVVKVEKDLRCNYIENASVYVEGDITVDYIIGGKITCKGNIYLAGTKELIVGGEVNLAGELVAKEIGNEREYPTIIRIIGDKTIDVEKIEMLSQKKAVTQQQLDESLKKETQVNELLLCQEKKDIINRDHDSEAMKQIGLIKKEIDKQVILLKKEIKVINEAIIETENAGWTNYYGSVSVKRKLYRGTRIYFGDMLFQFDLDTLEHCKIYWDNDNIVNGML